MHSISAVSVLTGIKASTLRSWERRYGIPLPVRSDAGRRLYDDAEVERLVLVAALNRLGQTIGELAPLTLAQLQERTRRSERPEAAAVLLGRPLAAVDIRDPGALRRLLGAALVSFPTLIVVTDILQPLMRRIGDDWEAGRITPLVEHVASAAVKQAVFAAAAHQGWTAGGPVTVFGTPEQELHEFGALFGWLIAISAGCNALNLGPNLPAAHVVGAVREFGARTIVLSPVGGPSAQSCVAAVAAVRRDCPEDVEVWVGAPAANPIHAHHAPPGLRTFRSFADFAREIPTRSMVRA